jgi:hypothetical protein
VYRLILGSHLHDLKGFLKLFISFCPYFFHRAGTRKTAQNHEIDTGGMAKLPTVLMLVLIGYQPCGCSRKVLRDLCEV